ncbi:unnamed protein product [Arctogadus glacialis]
MDVATQHRYITGLLFILRMKRKWCDDDVTLAEGITTQWITSLSHLSSPPSSSTHFPSRLDPHLSQVLPSPLDPLHVPLVPPPSSLAPFPSS